MISHDPFEVVQNITLVSKLLVNEVNRTPLDVVNSDSCYSTRSLFFRVKCLNIFANPTSIRRLTRTYLHLQKYSVERNH